MQFRGFIPCLFLLSLQLGCRESEHSHPPEYYDSARKALAGKDSAGTPRTVPSSPDFVITTDEKPIEFALGDSNAFYPVFEVSPKTQAIVLEAWYDFLRNQVDSLLQDIVLSEEYYKGGYLDTQPLRGIVDSTGPYRLLESKMATEKLMPFFKGEFYITCTNGVVKREMRSVLFAADYCRTSFFAITFDPIDVKTYGHPLLASRKMPSPPKNDPAPAKLFKQFNDSAILTWRDHSDKLDPVVFATLSDSLFFVYYDDFGWNGKNEDRECLFPAREAFLLINGKKVVSKWAGGLDLYGASCD
jgi:hypothetical protein